MTTDYNASLTTEIVAQYGARPEMLIQILHGLMQQHGWIPEPAIPQLADELNLSRADVHGVVSYYHDFRSERPARHIVRICQSEACQAMGSRELTQHAEKALGVAVHSGNEDVTLEPVYCLGNCGCSPAVMIDGKTYGRVDPDRFDELVQALQESD